MGGAKVGAQAESGIMNDNDYIFNKESGSILLMIRCEEINEATRD